MSVFEYNFDGLVGPSHHYAGLSKGNIASTENAMSAANPRAAALQGLAKMKQLHDLGFKQAILPPHLRPNIGILRALGFRGSDHQVIDKAWRDAPEIAAKCFSASAMWTANAATVSPSADTADGKTHFTPANLCRMFHRSYESKFTGESLRRIFSSEKLFHHHPALPSGVYFGDEGAANHTRLGASHDEASVELFVYGEQAFSTTSARPSKYPARQSLEASQAVARLHQLDPANTVYAQQNPQVIDAGVFHNDVIAVGSTKILFFHEHAFLDSDSVIGELRQKLEHSDFYPVMVPHSKVSVEDAVSTYLFNTQLLDRGDADFLLIAPLECKQNEAVFRYLNEIVESSAPINDIKYFDLRESMKNGGGPACLRLRVALNQDEAESIQARVILDDELYADLCAWVNQHYRDSMLFDDLRDPQIIDEMKQAMIALESIIELKDLYKAE